MQGRNANKYVETESPPRRASGNPLDLNDRCPSHAWRAATLAEIERFASSYGRRGVTETFNSRPSGSLKSTSCGSGVTATLSLPAMSRTRKRRYTCTGKFSGNCQE